MVVFAYSPDDAFIFLRYAANLVHGHGLVFNRGQRVEGFTSPLWVLVSTVTYLVPWGANLFKLKLASVIFGALAVREGGRILDALDASPWVTRVGYVTMGLCPVIAYCSSYGLETSLEMWLVASILARVVGESKHRGKEYELWVFAAAAALTRLDSLLPLGAVAFSMLFTDGLRSWWHRARWFLGAAAGAGLSIGIGAIYYGSWLPNTYYAKEVPLTQAIGTGWSYLHGLLQPAGFGGPDGNPRLVHVVILLEAAITLLGLAWAVKKRGRPLLLVAAVVGQAIFVLATGGDYMTGGRFLGAAAIPFIGVEVLGLAVAARWVVAVARRWVVRGALLLSSGLVVATSAITLAEFSDPAWTLPNVSDATLLTAGAHPLMARVWVELPRLLACVPNGSSVATSEIGFFGFDRLGLTIVDLRGLTDRAIARESSESVKGPMGVMDQNWYLPTSPVGRELLRQRPDVIVELDSVPSAVVLHNQYVLVREVNNVASLGIYFRRGWTTTCAFEASSIGPAALSDGRRA